MISFSAHDAGNGVREVDRTLAASIAFLAASLAAMWLGILVVMLLSHAWIVDAHGRPIVTDFFEVWVAGKTALSGQAYAAYDPHMHYAAEVAAAGHPFKGHLWWHYPPIALFQAAGVALLPYLPAFLCWAACSLAAYAAVVRAIARSSVAAIVALAAPAAFLNSIAGQNGCFSAVLIGGVLLNLETRPALAGILLGLLTYKPQLGLLFPIALAAGGNWRTFAIAAAVSVLGMAASTAVFGVQTFQAFLHYLPLAGTTMLVDNAGGWNKLQSLYTLARWLGFDNTAAWAFQLGAALACTAALIGLSRSSATAGLKAAALTVAILLATPYLYMYDYPILTLAFAFLYRERRFDIIEMAALCLANIFILLYALGLLVIPLGPLATAIAAAAVVRRYLRNAANSRTQICSGLAATSG